MQKLSEDTINIVFFLEDKDYGELNEMSVVYPRYLP